MNKFKNIKIPKKLKSQAELQAGLVALQKIDKNLIPFIRGYDDIALRWCAAGFAGLAQIIVAQQVSRASATAIMGRLKKILKPFNAKTYLTLSKAKLQGAGLSSAKYHTLLILAKKIEYENFSLTKLAKLPNEQAQAELMKIKGIGVWTAELFMMFCAGHIDIFPAKDIALQQAIMDIGLSKTRPSAEGAAKIANRWRPVRAVAARVLWAVYARKKIFDKS